jgi:hypothetical protein
VGEEADEEREADEVALDGDLTLVDVDRVGQRHERVEADPRGQDDVPLLEDPLGAEQVDHADEGLLEEVRVLEER